MKIHFALGVVLAALLTGCVSKPVDKEEHRPPLMTSQNSEGDVTISFESEPGYIYTILYSDFHRKTWTNLTNGQNLRGTGKTITIKDKVNPAHPRRHYWIKVQGQGVPSR
ncbi:MAG: hypothetical protein K9M45_08910 [Kiritimatiellales bacterium]|nr:hypothetical protein [Kiritimatiellales bacterium]